MSTSVLQKGLSSSDAVLKRACGPVLLSQLAQAASAGAPSDRKVAMQLSLRLSSIEGVALPVELICSLAAGLARTNKAYFRDLVDSLGGGFLNRLASVVQKEWEGQQMSLEAIGRLAALTASLACAPQLAVALGSSKALLLRLCEVYDGIIPKLLPPRTAFQTPLSRPARTALQARLDLLEAIDAALAAAYLAHRQEPSAREQLSDVLLALLDAPASSFVVETGEPRSLVTLGLMGDLESLCDISGRLAPLLAYDEATFGHLAESFRVLVPPRVASGLELLAGDNQEPITSIAAVVVDKGKGRAVEVAPPKQADADVQAVKAILPEQEESFIKRCLAHPRFAAAPHPAEALVDALLSDSLPADLANAPTEPPQPAAPSRSALSDIRANVFEDRLDMSKVTKGKQRIDLDANSALGKRIDEELRRNILAFARDDAERDEQFEREREIELDDYDPEAPVYSGPSRRRNIEEDVDEGASEDDDVPDEVDVSPQIPAPTPGAGLPAASSRILERAYLNDPSLFAPHPQARASPARRALRDQTGMANDLIESWAMMLERDPNKDRILSRHATVFAGNERGQVVPPTGQPESDRGRGRGRGGRGARGRGRGGGQHVQRQRGHDRKVGRAGGP